MKPAELKKHLNDYQSRKRKWTFPAQVRRLFYDFEDLEENKAIQHLNQKFEIYGFIYDNLTTPEDKSFFKSDFQEHLELLKSKQRVKKFVILIEGYIQRLDKPEKKTSKAGRPKVEIKPAYSYLKFDEEKSKLFLEKLRGAFPISEPKQLFCVIIALSDFEYLEVKNQKAVYYSFADYFKGECGSYSGFSYQWRKRKKNKTELLELTKKEVGRIKRINVIV